MVEKYDILGQLPIETVQVILMHIPPENLCKVSKCCKRWKNITRGTYFWKKKSEQDYNFAGLEYVESECYRKYVQNFSNHWQGHYMYNCELEYNWKNGLCKKITVDSILDLESFVYMDDDLLIFVKAHEICVINISNGLIEKTFQVEHFFRAVVEKNEGLLIVLCHILEDNDASLIIKVWDLKTKDNSLKFEHSLRLRYTKFCVYKHLIAFIIYETRELHVFNIKNGVLVYKSGHVRGMCFGSNTIAIRTGVRLIEIVDLNNFKVLMKITCCKDKTIQKLEIKNNYLFVECVRVDAIHRYFHHVTRSTCVWDLTTNTKLCTIDDGQFLDLTFIDENKIICLKRNLTGNWLECLSLPHFVTQTIIGQKRSRTCMYTSNNRYFFTEITETSLKMCCSRTQKFITSFDLEQFHTNRYFSCRFGQIDILMVSNKNLAYVEKVDGKYIVHIMDFGPDIENKITFI